MVKLEINVNKKYTLKLGNIALLCFIMFGLGCGVGLFVYPVAMGFFVLTLAFIVLMVGLAFKGGS